MALQLAVQSKGIQADYWKIIQSSYSVFGNQTSLTLALYVSKETRTAGLNNFLETQSFQFDGFLDQATMYSKITESKKAVRETTPAVYEMNDDVTIKMPAVIVIPAVEEEYEANQFANAVNI